MNRRRKTLVALAAVVVGGVLFWFFQPREPRYQGKTVTQWIEEMHPLGSPRTNKVFKAMLRELGSDAAPPLVQILERETGWKRRAAFKLSLLTGSTWLTRKLESDRIASYARVHNAAYGLKQLGTNASAVAPRLGRILRNPSHARVAPAVIDVLESMGPNGISELTTALTKFSGPERLSLETALVLCKSPNPPPDAIAVLVAACQVNQGLYTREAVEALEPFVNSYPTVRGLMTSLQINSDIRISRLAGAILWRANQTNLASDP